MKALEQVNKQKAQQMQVSLEAMRKEMQELILANKEIGKL